MYEKPETSLTPPPSSSFRTKSKVRKLKFKNYIYGHLTALSRFTRVYYTSKRHRRENSRPYFPRCPSKVHSEFPEPTAASENSKKKIVIELRFAAT